MQWKNPQISLNANQLKLIAIIAMVIDHCASILMSEETSGVWCLRTIGRIAAPIMCFFIAEGYHYTSNLKKYMVRLLLMAVISHVPYNLCFEQDLWAFWLSTDVGFSLLFGLIALAIWESDKTTTWQKYLGLALCCLLAYPANWNYIAVLWIFGFGIFHGDYQKQILSFSLIAGIYLAQPFLYDTDLSVSRLGVFLVIPLLLLYNGQRGRKSKLIQQGFYWFYPVHLMVIYLISLII